MFIPVSQNPDYKTTSSIMMGTNWVDVPLDLEQLSSKSSLVL